MSPRVHDGRRAQSRRQGACPAGRASPSGGPVPRGAPPRPRRVSGPAVGALGQPGGPASGWPRGCWSSCARCPTIRCSTAWSGGEVWIPLLGVLLAGMVSTQVEVLRLNASMGRSLGQDSALEVRNQALRASVAELSDDARIERLAGGMGMTMPAPTGLPFCARGASLTRAIQNIHAPASDQFQRSCRHNGCGDREHCFPDSAPAAPPPAWSPTGSSSARPPRAAQAPGASRFWPRSTVASACCSSPSLPCWPRSLSSRLRTWARSGQPSAARRHDPAGQCPDLGSPERRHNRPQRHPAGDQRGRR